MEPQRWKGFLRSSLKAFYPKQNLTSQDACLIHSDSMLPFVALIGAKHISPPNCPLDYNALDGKKHALFVFISLRVPGVVLST